MKRLFIIMLLISCCGKVFPQFYEDETISPFVKEYFSLTDDYTKYDTAQNIPNGELNHIIKLLFKSYDEDPIGCYNEWKLKQKELEKRMVECNWKRNEPTTGFKETILQKPIRKIYGEKYTEIISTPAFIRGKVTAINMHNINDPNMLLTQVDLTVYIEEVLKSKKFFKKGTTITVSYIQQWLSKQYEVNKSYLFPLKPWTYSGENKGEITINILYYERENAIPFEGPEVEIYPIENESVFSEKDFFETGKWTNWEEFKKHFKITYMKWEQ